MSSALASIIEGVLEDLDARKLPLSQLREQLAGAAAIRDAYGALNIGQLALIAEVKRSSPSKGALASISDPADLALQYQNGGANVVSVLTEGRRFGGSIADLVKVRSAIDLPVLRKDFIVTEYQVIETRAIGADLLLLIVAGLSDSQLKDFHQLATELGLAVLVEVHDELEIERALAISPRIIGVNSRNLKTLEINRGAFARLLPLIPSELTRIAESGISTRSEVEEIEGLGAQAILVGETLVRASDPLTGIKLLLGK
ncbi:MAG: indole-3-glycerol phosphate synthase TrpC [Actinomycetes bacterium]